MEKLKKIGTIILGTIFALSSAMLSIQLIVVDYRELNIWITSIVSFVCAIWFYKKTIKENYNNIKNNIILTTICIILSLIFMKQLYITKALECREMLRNFIINPFELRYFFISALSVMYLFIYLGNVIKKWAYNFYKLLSSWDKKAYIITSVISFIIIVITYSLNTKIFLQYDNIYSLDSGDCFVNIFPKASYYDIRHPLLSVFTFPMWAIADEIGKIFLLPDSLSQIITAIILQVINAQFLILIGLQLKMLSKSKMVFILYMLSFPTILFSLFFEKYQLCIFFIVSYVFSICNSKKGASANLIAAAGTMPTSCVIGISELLTNDKIKDKIKRVLKIIFATLLVFICFGRAHIFRYGIIELLYAKNNFASGTYTIIERLISTTKMLEDCFIALPSVVINSTYRLLYTWKNIKDSISILSIIIIAIVIIGAIKNRKNLFTKICLSWFIFSIILFVVLNWSTDESPLFSIYFSWAIIPLFVMGLECVIEKVKVNSKLIYTSMITLMTIINVATMIGIINFLNL